MDSVLRCLLFTCVFSCGSSIVFISCASSCHQTRCESRQITGQFGQSLHVHWAAANTDHIQWSPHNKFLWIEIGIIKDVSKRCWRNRGRNSISSCTLKLDISFLTDFLICSFLYSFCAMVIGHLLNPSNEQRLSNHSWAFPTGLH